ncbi:hypothetical protein HHI36_002096 [Cryptolaemus montrouzieri]|uniref:Fanconi anemia group M protein n=1 Tax=Cryptolaemus montrouzieri TaxID=559131 RepID=A0ABD2PA53_9CUCU
MNIKQKSIMEFCRETNEENTEIEGFDIQSGLSWIYPTNYPLRDYQFNIIQQALYKNTLVSLPTGLGKTFIAAVVMYNFYRWYPTGKIVFMAPTKPLVKQQVEACYNIMAIPRDVTAELTGTKQNLLRNNIWTEKRVFFVTPQVFQNDLDSFSDLGASIKCIVFDEAHKARGNYAYCEVIRKLKQYTKHFRVLALSATPGNGVEDIVETITNLMISHVEFRTEESLDVKPYVFRRNLETVVVPLGEKLEQVKGDYIEVLEVNARALIKYKIVRGNCSTLTKGRIFNLKKDFQQRSTRDPNYNEIMRTLTHCMTLYHAYELLIRHGLRGFLSFWEEHIEKPLFRNNMSLRRIVEDIRDYLGPLPNMDPFPDGTYPEVPMNVKFGHPKFYKLRDILVTHFTNSEENSRVIVFFEYRDSVMEAFIVLLQVRPLIRAKIFLGQKSGITQRVQLNVLKSFRDGDCNTLLSTCIGEEGLDVGEVDLIVCFDISNKSPIRMVQRMGRTGRKREGQVIILVTEGKEQQTLNECLMHKNSMKNVIGSSKVLENYFVKSPRMVPANISPKCMKIQITVKPAMITKRSSLKDMFRSITSGSSSSTLLDDVELVEIKEKLPESICLFNKSASYISDFNIEPYSNKSIEQQRCLQGGMKVGSSDACSVFVELLKFADSKRFNIPLTQEAKEVQSKNLRQGDIRNMFMKASSKSGITTSQDDFATQNTQSTSSSTIPITQSITQTQSTNLSTKSDELYRDLHMEVANYLSIELTTKKGCGICERLFQCNVPYIANEVKFLEDLKHWIPPDFSVVEKITLEDLDSYEKTLIGEGGLKKNDVEDSILELINDNNFPSTFPQSEILDKKVKEKSYGFNAPKSFERKNIEISATENLKELLLFFKLEKIEDIFDSQDDIVDCSINSDTTIICSDIELKSVECEAEYPLSPILSTQLTPRKQEVEDDELGSPVLRPRETFKSLKDRTINSRCSLDIIDSSLEDINSSKSAKRGFQVLPRSLSTSSKRKDNIEELNVSKDDSEDENLLGVFGVRKKQKFPTKLQDVNSLDLGDLCDLSAFGLTLDEKEEGKIENGNFNQIQMSTIETNDSLKKKPTPSNNKNKNMSKKVVNECMKTSYNTQSLLEPAQNLSKAIGDKNLQIRSRISQKQQIISSTLEHNIKFPDNDHVGQINNMHDITMLVHEESFSVNRSNVQKSWKGPSKEPIKKQCKPLEILDHKQNEAERNENNVVHKKNYKDECILESVDVSDLDWSKDLTQKNSSNQCKETQSCASTVPKMKHSDDFDSFFSRLSRDSVSTQRETQISGDQLKNTCMNEKSDITNNIIETVVIPDSPDKENFIDLTLSSEDREEQPSKRKKLSQMSITQIITLVSKSSSSTKSTLISQSKNNISISSDVQNIATKSKSIEKAQNTSILDDLRNFEDFNQSFNLTKPSPFKKPEIRKHCYKNNQQKKLQSKTNLASCSKLNGTNLGTDSDDEFDYIPNVSSSLSRMNRSAVIENNSDDEFETTFYGTGKQKESLKSQMHLKVLEKKTKVKKKRSDFIEEEADVSSDALTISDDENSADDGSYDESFVDDETQALANDTQMHVRYLQSVKSPQAGPKFKIPAIPKPITSDIFSQPVNPEEFNSYINDSFV